jgi:hypothetical protein
LQDGGDQFGDRDPRVGAKPSQNSAQRETHSVSADQHMAVAAAPHMIAGQLRERDFRTAHPAVHQGDGAGQDRELIAAAHEPQIAAVRHLCSIQVNPGNHGEPRIL